MDSSRYSPVDQKEDCVIEISSQPDPDPTSDYCGKYHNPNEYPYEIKGECDEKSG